MKAKEAMEWAKAFIDYDGQWLDDWNAEEAREAVKILLAYAVAFLVEYDPFLEGE